MNSWIEYDIGDPSGVGIGAEFYIDGVLLFRYGQWTSSISEISSNYKDLRNLMEALEKDIREGKLKDCEVFLVTDNIETEDDFYRVFLSSKTLFNLVFRLCKLEL